jgi:hypothetical protein
VAEYNDLESGLRSARRAQQELADHVSSLVDIEAAERFKAAADAAEVVPFKPVESA